MWNIRSPNFNKTGSRIRLKANETDNSQRWVLKDTISTVKWRVKGKFKASEMLNQRWELLASVEHRKASWQCRIRGEVAELYVENVVRQYIHRERRLQVIPRPIAFSFIVRQILKERALRAFSFLPRQVNSPEQGLLFSFVLREGQEPEQGLLFSFLAREAEKTEQGMLFSFLLRTAQKPEQGVNFSFLPRQVARTEQGQVFSFLFRELGKNQEDICFSFLIREIDRLGGLVDFSFLVRNLKLWEAMQQLGKQGVFIPELGMQMLTQQKRLTAEQVISIKKRSVDVWTSRHAQLAADTEIDTRQWGVSELTLREKEQVQDISVGFAKNEGQSEVIKPKCLKKNLFDLQEWEESPLVKIDDNKQAQCEREVVWEKKNSAIGTHKSILANKLPGNMEKVQSFVNMNLDLQSKAMLHLMLKAFLVRECDHRAIVEHDAKWLSKRKQIHREYGRAVEKDHRPKPIFIEEKEHFVMKQGEMLESDTQSKFARTVQEIEEGAKVLKFIRLMKWFTLHEEERTMSRIALKFIRIERGSVQGVKQKPYSLLKEVIEHWGQKVSVKEFFREKAAYTITKVKLPRELRITKDKYLGRIMKQERLSIEKDMQEENARNHTLSDKVSYESVYAKEQELMGSKTNLLKVDRLLDEEIASVYAKQEIAVKTEEERKAELIQRFWTVLSRELKDSIILPDIDYPYEGEPLIFEVAEQNNTNFNSVFPNEFYKIIDKHPINAGNGMGVEERPTEIAVMVDMINILIMMWFKYVSAFWGWTGTQAVTGITTSLYEYMNLENSRNKQFEHDLYHDYNRVFRWVRWEAEKVAFMARDDMELRGNHYVEMLLEELIDYMLDHHFDVMPIFEDVNKMDEWRTLFERPIESDISWVLDKVKGIRHKKLGGKR